MSTVEYVKASVLADDALATPLVVGHASRLLAAVTLSTFPTTAGPDESRHDTDSKPALLRRAVDYMDRNADNDIALADVAQALERMRGQDAMDGMEGEAMAVGVDVRGVTRELGLEAPRDLVRIARLGKHPLPHVGIRRVMDAVPAVAHRRGHDHGR